MHPALAAALQVHETAKYIPMTAKDGQTAKEAGIFAGCVAVGLVLLSIVRGGGKKAAPASK